MVGSSGTRVPADLCLHVARGNFTCSLSRWSCNSRPQSLFRQSPRLLSRRLIASSTQKCSVSLTSYHEQPTSPTEQDIITELQKPSRADHLDPSPESYNATPFTDRCAVSIYAGAGGHGCVSFLREKFIAEGPANGGDGGDGGSIWIQAVRGETSLHKLARKREIRAGRGGNGRGKGQGGELGKDVLITVPVGTIVREVHRVDPRIQDMRKRQLVKGDDEEIARHERDKWISYPGMTSYETKYLGAPKLPQPRSSTATAMQPQTAIKLDLDAPMNAPLLLAAGAVGGLGNPHFVSREFVRPKYATKGEAGMSMMLEFELKMLADVGLVGLPNAGKSTLLRAISNSRTRIGNWAFTTLQPSVGTVVLDDNRGRPELMAFERNGQPRTNFTVADIPGLIVDAHLDKGLGLGFLRHVERASVLAFVVDLAAGDAVRALQALWREVGEYETLRNRQVNEESEDRIDIDRLHDPGQKLSAMASPISSKPWLVVATKADLPGTEDNFQTLQSYVAGLKRGQLEHPSGRANAWRIKPVALPVSAINAAGVDQIPRIVTELLA